MDETELKSWVDTLKTVPSVPTTCSPASSLLRNKKYPQTNARTLTRRARPQPGSPPPFDRTVSRARGDGGDAPLHPAPPLFPSAVPSPLGAAGQVCTAGDVDSPFSTMKDTDTRSD